MGSGKTRTPGRSSLKAMLGWGGGEAGEGNGGSSAGEGPQVGDAARAAAGGGDATIDIGALMRKRQLLVPSGGGAGGGLAASRQTAQPLPAFGSMENPVYSPDDSLAKAASKLQSLKALRASVTRLVAQAGPAGPLAVGKAELAQQRCKSPRLQAASQKADEGPRLSDEDSGDLAALSALQQRRKSVHPSSAHKQRYGTFWEGDDTDLEHTLHEYNRGIPAASPRMTRAQRRKSMGVNQSLQLEAGLAKAAGEEQLGEENGGSRGQQPSKRPAANQRESLAGGHLERQESVADEVAALNAELCAQLDGMIEESPEKGHRGDSRSLRDKLLESWDGKTYYERLMEVAKAPEQQHAGSHQPPAAQQRQPAKPVSRAAAPPKAVAPVAASRATPAPIAAGAAAAAKVTTAPQPAAVKPPVLQVAAPAGTSTTAAKAGLLTPNGQPRKLNELAQSLQLLKVSSRHQLGAGSAAARGPGPQAAAGPLAAAGPPAAARPAAAAGKAAEGASSPRQHQEEVPVAPAAAAASRTPRTRSASPEAAAAAGGAQAAIAATSSRQPSAPVQAAPKTATKRGAKRGTTSVAEASTVVGHKEQQASAGQPALAADVLRGELAAAYEMLTAALADKDRLAEQLQGSQAQLAAERNARVAAEQELEKMRQAMVNVQRERQEEAATGKAAEQRSKQLAKELAEAQLSAIAAGTTAAERAADLEARFAEAERALSNILKAANSSLKAVTGGREEAKGLAEALRSGAENAPAGGAATRQLRQSGGRLWR